MKTKSEQRPDNILATPECGSVEANLNLLPKSEQNSQGLENADNSIAINRDANESEISLERIGDVSESDVTGCNMNGSDNNVCSQHNTVTNNHGITGISGTGHTINVYQYPKEFVELFKKFMTMGALS
jgi:hypothetical protein